METPTTVMEFLVSVAPIFPDVSRSVARANEEMAELAEKIHLWASPKEIGFEVADVVINLWLAAHAFERDIVAVTEGMHSVISDAGQDISAIMVSVHKDMAILIKETVTERRGYILTQCIGQVITHLDYLCKRFSVDLQEMIDAKMKINRGRRWRCDNYGGIYHIKEDE
jgi:NTP pyrophosphatase (non-canonical NTP hydrolase)